MNLQTRNWIQTGTKLELRPAFLLSFLPKIPLFRAESFFLEFLLRSRHAKPVHMVDYMTPLWCLDLWKGNKRSGWNVFLKKERLAEVRERKVLLLMSPCCCFFFFPDLLYDESERKSRGFLSSSPLKPLENNVKIIFCLSVPSGKDRGRKVGLLPSAFSFLLFFFVTGFSHFRSGWLHVGRVWTRAPPSGGNFKLHLSDQVKFFLLHFKANRNVDEVNYCLL